MRKHLSIFVLLFCFILVSILVSSCETVKDPVVDNGDQTEEKNDDNKENNNEDNNGIEDSGGNDSGTIDSGGLPWV